MVLTGIDMDDKDISSHFSFSQNIEKEKTLFIKAWERLIDHPVLTLPTREERRELIQSDTAQLDTQLSDKTLHLIRVEKHAVLLMSAFINKPDPINHSLLLRVLLTTDDLTEEDELAAWHTVLNSINEQFQNIDTINMYLPTGPSQHTKLLAKLGFINTHAHPSEEIASVPKFDRTALEYWTYSIPR